MQSSRSWHPPSGKTFKREMWPRDEPPLLSPSSAASPGQVLLTVTAAHSKHQAGHAVGGTNSVRPQETTERSQGFPYAGNRQVCKQGPSASSGRLPHLLSGGFRHPVLLFQFRSHLAEEGKCGKEGCGDTHSSYLLPSPKWASCWCLPQTGEGTPGSH